MIQFALACMLGGGLTIALNLYLVPRVERERW